MANTANAKDYKLATKTTLESSVAGISFDGRQNIAYALSAASRKKDCRTWVELRRERGNERDANAVAVVAHITGTTNLHARVGYLPADIAKSVAAAMDAGARARIAAYAFVGGYRGRNIGMRLSIDVIA